MVRELELVIQEVEKLSVEAQKELSKSWLDEVKWQASFQESENELALLAKEALAEYKKGNTKNL